MITAYRSIAFCSRSPEVILYAQIVSMCYNQILQTSTAENQIDVWITEQLNLFSSSDVVVIISVLILIGLFSMQHYGTDKVSWLFAPIVFVWFILIGILGAVNICKYDHSVLKAFNPVYVYRYFKRGKTSWTSLGGIMLSITGLLLT